LNMKIHGSILGIFCFLFCFSTEMQAQNRGVNYQEYIRIHSELAIKHMHQYKIPASIKLAQALLESGAGTSDLVHSTNNHFAIKCNSNWSGDCKSYADDRPNDKFRVYQTVEESFEDHSRFLQQPRYRMLFDLDIKDYAAWAKGLHGCGYATDPAYANKLIKLIEDYELYRYDALEDVPKESPKDILKETSKPARIPLKRSVSTVHGLRYVLAETDDSYARIAEDLGLKIENITKYNEMPGDFPLSQGDIVYLEKKLNKADNPYFEHIVKTGESMYSIAQQYGMQVKSLYGLNKKKSDYVPAENDVLRLR